MLSVVTLLPWMSKPGSKNAVLDSRSRTNSQSSRRRVVETEDRISAGVRRSRMAPDCPKRLAPNPGRLTETEGGCIHSDLNDVNALDGHHNVTAPGVEARVEARAAFPARPPPLFLFSWEASSGEAGAASWACRPLESYKTVSAASVAGCLAAVDRGVEARGVHRLLRRQSDPGGP